MKDSASTVVVMNQYARGTGDTSTNGRQASAIGGFDHILSFVPERSGSRPGGVHIGVLPVQGLIVLRAREQADALDRALKHRCGLSLPERLQSTDDASGSYCTRWMSPDSWLLSCPLAEAYSIEKDVRAEVDGAVALVNVSGGYSQLIVRGAGAQQVLMKSTGYDVHVDHLPAGKVVNTVFAKTQVTLRAIARALVDAKQDSDDDCFELIVRRSYSDYLWLWLQRASQETGFSVQSIT